MDTQNSQKRSPRDSAKTKQETTASPDAGSQRRRPNHDQEDEHYYDRSLDHVARVRAAKEAAQRRMEEFGDVSEYDVGQGSRTGHEDIEVLTAAYSPGHLRAKAQASAVMPLLRTARA